MVINFHHTWVTYISKWHPKYYIYTNNSHLSWFGFPPEAQSATRTLAQVVDVGSQANSVVEWKSVKGVLLRQFALWQPKRTLTLLSLPNKGQGAWVCSHQCSIGTKRLSLKMKQTPVAASTCWEPRVRHSGPEKALRQRQKFAFPGIGGTWRDLESLLLYFRQKKARFSVKIKSKHSRLCRPLQLCYWTQPGSYSKSSHTWAKVAWLCLSEILGTLKCEFPYDSHVLKISFSFDFFQPLKNKKLFFVCSHTNIGDCIWSVAIICPTSVLDYEDI